MFNIRLARLCPESGEEVASSTLSFVDLAGCERVSRTGNQGVRLKCVGKGTAFRETAVVYVTACAAAAPNSF